MEGSASRQDLAWNESGELTWGGLAGLGAELRAYLNRSRVEQERTRIAAEQGEHQDIDAETQDPVVDLEEGVVAESQTVAATDRTWHGSTSNPLAIARIRAGLRQADVAAELNVHVNTIFNWEHSAHPRPPFEALSRMANLYGITVDELIGRVDG